MRKLIYVLVLMAVWGVTASPAGAAAGAPAEFGAVRSNTGTLYAVGSSGGAASVSTIETAGWNTCTSGYSLVGYDFDQNGFWLCARSDLASSVFYVGNVVNNAGYWWQVQGGRVTSEGYEGWNYCPASATLLGTEFNSNGFWVCYVAPPPPPAPSGGGTTTVAPPPSSPPPSTSPPATPKRLTHLRVRILLRWVWDGAQTWLTGLRFTRLPRDATVSVACRGRGCPRTPVRASARHLTKLRRQLVRHRYRRGDRITIKVTAPGTTPEVASVVIRDGRKPRAGLLAA
jgi:hypothetical protein